MSLVHRVGPFYCVVSFAYEVNVTFIRVKITKLLQNQRIPDVFVIIFGNDKKLMKIRYLFHIHKRKRAKFHPFDL